MVSLVIWGTCKEILTRVDAGARLSGRRGGSRRAGRGVFRTTGGVLRGDKCRGLSVGGVYRRTNISGKDFCRRFGAGSSLLSCCVRSRPAVKPSLLRAPGDLRSMGSKVIHICLGCMTCYHRLNMRFVTKCCSAGGRTLGPTVEARHPCPVIAMRTCMRRTTGSKVVGVERDVSRFAASVQVVIVKGMFR